MLRHSVAYRSPAASGRASRGPAGIRAVSRGRHLRRWRARRLDGDAAGRNAGPRRPLPLHRPAQQRRPDWSWGGTSRAAWGRSALLGDSATIETSLDAPGMVAVEITGAPGDKPITLGAAVAPLDLEPSVPRPDDFDSFWDAKLAAACVTDSRAGLQTRQSALRRLSEAPRPGRAARRGGQADTSRRAQPAQASPRRHHRWPDQSGPRQTTARP